MGCVNGVAANDMVVEEAIRKGCPIIDARPKEEFEKGHAMGAISCPANGGSAAIAQIKQALKDKIHSAIVVYSENSLLISGKDAAIIKSELTKNGFSRVINAGSMDRVKFVRDKMSVLSPMAERAMAR